MCGSILTIDRQIHRKVAVKGHALLHEALQASYTGASADFAAEQTLDRVFAVNTLQQPRRELVLVPNAAVGPFVCQKVPDSNQHLVLFETSPGTNVAFPVAKPKVLFSQNVLGATGSSQSRDYKLG